MEGAITESDGRVVAADYILACIRSVISSPYERYTKYSMARAWAGAFLGLTDGYCEVYFDSLAEDTPPTDRSRMYRSDGIRISIYGEPVSVLDRAHRVLPEAFARAKQILASGVDGLPLRSLHVSFIMQDDGSGHPPRRQYEEVCDKLATPVGGRITVAPVITSAFGDRLYNGDLTFELSSPMTAGELHQATKQIFPDVSPNLTGWGALPLQCVESRVTWAHVYARHFFREFVHETP